MALREILVQLGVDLKKSDVDKADKAVNGLAVAARGAAAAFAAIGAAKVLSDIAINTAKFGDELAKTSKQIGVQAQELQELRFAANLAGATNEDVTKSLRTLSKSTLEAQQGSASFVEDFERLGVPVNDVNGNLKPATQLMQELADGMGNLGSDTERVALAQSLLGRSGTKLLPFLRQGSDAIDQQRKRARELGEVMDDELLVASEALVDAQREQEGAVQGLRIAFSKELIPFITKATESFTEFIISIRPFITQVGKRVVSLFKQISTTVLPRIINTLKGALEGLITGFRFIIGLIEQFRDSLSESNQVLFDVVLAFGALTAILGAPLVLLLLIAAAITLVANDLNAMGGGGESVIGTLITGFADLVKKTGSVSGAIAEMLEVSAEGIAEFLGISKETSQVIGDMVNSISRFVAFLADITVQPIKDLISDIRLVVDLVSQLFSLTDKFGATGFAAGLKDIGANLPGLAGRQLPGSSLVRGALQSGGGGGANINQVNNLDISVDAGAADAQETATMTARAVERVNEDQVRLISDNFSVATAGP